MSLGVIDHIRIVGGALQRHVVAGLGGLDHGGEFGADLRHLCGFCRADQAGKTLALRLEIVEASQEVALPGVLAVGVG